MNSYGKYKNRLSKFTLMTTIIDGMISLGLTFVVGYAIFLIDLSSEVIGESSEVISNAGEHDLTGGYEALSGMGGGFVGFMGSIFGMVMLIAAGFLLLIMLSIMIHGIIVCVKASERFMNNMSKYVKAYRRDSIIKIVIHGIFAFMMFAFMFANDSFSVMAIFIGCLLLTVLGLSVVNLMMLKAGNRVVE